MAARAVDRRVRRTRSLLQQALLALIRERGFAALTVQDIIDRPDVGRATFYAHFDNKEDLLLAGLDGLRASLGELQREALARQGPAEERLLAFGHELFAHTAEHRDVFLAMVGDRSVALLHQAFHRILVDLVRGEVKAMLSRNKTGAPPPEPIVEFVAGGLFGLLM